MDAKHKYQIFKAQDVNVFSKGWFVDISPNGFVDPDFYYHFDKLRHAKKFRDLVEGGVPARIAIHEALS